MGLPVRVKEYSITEVFEAFDEAVIALTKWAVLADDVKFSIKNQRMELFKMKGIVCVTCSLEATHFVLESQAETIKPHFNLYATVGEKEILFTKDHIFPKSKGGANELENYQTMCSPCNRLKSDTWSEPSCIVDLPTHKDAGRSTILT